jgi:hypothetical protein
MGSWGYDVIKPLLSRTFPHTEITYDDTKPPTLVVKSHFANHERLASYSCPYITWSGESYRVRHNQEKPILEINTIKTREEQSLWIPYLIYDHKQIERPSPNPKKEWCCSFTYSNRVAPREQLFVRMRSLEPTCYAFGPSCRTPDNPFLVPNRSDRSQNHIFFNKFAFNVAMENCILPGYMTEKIGYAFRSGSVPIYWGDSACAKEFFNPESFLDVSDFASLQAAADYAVELWKDPQKLQKYLDAPIRVNNVLADYEAVHTEYRPWQQPFLTCMREAFPDLH